MKTFALSSLFVPIVASLVILSSSAWGADLSNGLMYALPVPAGQTPAMDGTDKGWDLTASEPVWYSTQLAKELHAKLALNYDDANLYVYARISLPDRKLKNTNGPADPYWQGDQLEFRLASDPTLPRPLSMLKPAIAGSNRVCHIALWKDTANGVPYISIQYGGMHGNSRGKAFNPPGSQISVVEGVNEYVIETKLPWTVLNVPDGKNPFGPGQRMTAVFGLHWLNSTWFYDVSAVYADNPGDFAFSNWGTWGQVEFSPTGNLPPRHGTMEEALASAVPAPVGVPITVDVAAPSKISVNIFGEHGEVLRELTGGQDVKPGKFTIYWDGKDQWGSSLPPGNYKWGAYFSNGLKARLVGFVGSSGNPPYPTEDGKGGWGGDHGVPTAVAADASGIYFGWAGSEAQRAIVKIDYAGNTLWRKTPFVQGVGGLYGLASNGKYLFAVMSGTHSDLCRLDATTGVSALYGNELGKGASVPVVAGTTPVVAPENSLPPEGGLNKDGTAPESIGAAATDKEVFVPIYSKNIIQVLDVETGQPTRTLDCPAPRGLTLDSAGNLYAVSCGTTQPPQILRFQGVQGSSQPVVTHDLVAPVGMAVDSQGQICVTDEGTSQQIKIFKADGTLVRTLGKEGGRPWAGAYDNTSYLSPSAIVADAQGGIVVTESSIPKIFDRIDLASGKTLARWFGWPGYGVSNIGDADDPMTSYYPFEPEGFARATVPAEGQTGYPDAYWVPSKAQPDVNQTYGYQMLPYVSRLDNGKKYFIDDGNPHCVSLIDGANLLPVCYLDARSPHDRRLPDLKAPSISMWIDTQGTHQVKPEDVTTITTLQDGTPLPNVAQRADSMWVDHAGNAYLLTQTNSVLEIPSDGFLPNGAIKWNPAKARLIVPTVIPSLITHLGTSPRSGMQGVRVDLQGNLYTCLDANVPGVTPQLADKIKAQFPDLPQEQWCAYADPDLAKKMKEGLGHTAESNAVKFAKFSPDGKMLWIAGRKATGAPGPGEMYHFWSMAGLVDNKYVAGSSEWGPIYFYTSDGYYVDALMNDPAELTPAGPYTFGSENFAGQIATYDKLGKVYAYDQGGIYAVDGFKNDLTVDGEKRVAGTVKLDKVYEAAAPTAVAQQLQLVPLSGDVSQAETWNSAPVVTLTHSTGTLATAQIGCDASNLYARIHVVDDTPLQNGADDLGAVFKGGDVAGIDLGPAGDRTKPGLGDIRLLAAMVHGQPRLLGMKVVSQQAKQPFTYFTPASGNKKFDFVGDVPGGSAVLTPDADGKGYTALLSVPKSFLEFPISAGTSLKGDVEVLLSGIGQRGLQAVSRNWLYSGGHVETTMVDDVPTEAWLYPQYWGDVSVK